MLVERAVSVVARTPPTLRLFASGDSRLDEPCEEVDVSARAVFASGPRAMRERGAATRTRGARGSSGRADWARATTTSGPTAESPRTAKRTSATASKRFLVCHGCDI